MRAALAIADSACVFKWAPVRHKSASGEATQGDGDGRVRG
jgi:hypothetical protein